MATGKQVQAGRARRGKKNKTAPSVGDLKQEYYNAVPLPVIKSSGTGTQKQAGAKQAAAAPARRPYIKDLRGGTAKQAAAKAASPMFKKTPAAREYNSLTTRRPTYQQQRQADIRELQRNSLKWRAADLSQTMDAGQRNSYKANLAARNAAIRKRHGLSYDPATGVTKEKNGEYITSPSTSAQAKKALAKERADDTERFKRNSVQWHGADRAKQTALEHENARIRSKYGWTYNPETGITRNERGGMVTDAEGIARKKSYDRQNPLSVIGHNTGAALAGINKGFWNTVDFLWPDPIEPKAVKNYIRDVTASAQEGIDKVNRYNRERGGKAGAAAGSLYQSAAQMLPQAVAALMSGGTSEAASAASKLTDAGRSTIERIGARLAKPEYMSSFLSTVGNDYEDAKARGASDLEAAVSAIVGSAVNAGIEVGGGLETAARKTPDVKSLLKSAREEGMEELKQDAVTGLTQAAVFDRERPLVTFGSGEGALDTARGAESYAAGAILGGAAGAVNLGLTRSDARSGAASEERGRAIAAEKEARHREREAARRAAESPRAEEGAGDIKPVPGAESAAGEAKTQAAARGEGRAINLKPDALETRRMGLENVRDTLAGMERSEETGAALEQIEREIQEIDRARETSRRSAAEIDVDENFKAGGRERELLVRLFELDAEMRETQYLLPGPMREDRIGRIENEMKRVSRELRDIASGRTAAREARTGTQAAQDAREAARGNNTPGADAPLQAAQNARTARSYNNTPGTDAPLQAAQAMPQGGKKRGKPKNENAAAYLYRNLVSGQAEIEKLAKAQSAAFGKNGRATANDLVQMNRSASSTVDAIAANALVDRKGDRTGASWKETLAGMSETDRKTLNLYRQHLHNIDRMSLEENAAPALKEAKERFEGLADKYPRYAKMTDRELSRLAAKGDGGAKEFAAAKEKLERLESVTNKPVLSKPEGTGDAPYTAEESRDIIARMDAENPRLREWTERAEEFHDAFMREWAVGSGLMSEEQYRALREKYPHYVQTFRVKDNWGGTDTVSRANIDAHSPIKEALGDISEIVPFEDAEMAQVNSIVKSARRNELFRNMYDFAKAHKDEAAPYVKIFDMDEDYEAPDTLEELAANLERDAMADQGGVCALTVMIDGKPCVMQVNSRLYAGLQNLYGQDRGASDKLLAQTLGKATNAFKQLTTGRNPFFFLTNLPKDFQTAYINTTSDRKILLTYLAQVAESAGHMRRQSADWQAFKALGGKSSNYYNNNLGYTKSGANANKHPVLGFIPGVFDTISENAEALWRFNEYRAVIKKYGDSPETRAKAIQAAADVTTNFSRTAPGAKAAENYCAYLNAGIQGLDKMARQLKAHPVQSLIRMAEIETLPTLLLWLINKDDENYQKLNNRTKDNYFCVPISGSDGKFLKIPRSREYGVVMGAMMERFFNLAAGSADGFSEALEGIPGQIATNLLPSNIVTDNILKTFFIDLPNNRDFAGRSIVPERLLGLSPENQYDYSTSGAGMAAAGAWNATAGRISGKKLSPIQADYLIDANLGFLGDAILAFSSGVHDPKEYVKSAAANPARVIEPVVKFIPETLERKFIADPLYQNGVTDKFYKELEQAEQAVNDQNLLEGIPSEAVTPDEKYLQSLKSASSDIAGLRKQERDVMDDASLSDDEKDKRVREIRDKITRLADEAPAEAARVRAEYEKNYIPEIADLSEERQAEAREAVSHGIKASDFARVEKRLEELKKNTDRFGKRVHTDAEALGITLKEVMKDENLTDGEKQAIADYQLIASMGDDTKAGEDWAALKGRINASDFLKFKVDTAKYDEEYKKTGADNPENIAGILRGYESLNDEQRDLLFQTKYDNMENNPFHVSVYEKEIDKNGRFYSGLTEDGRLTLRKLLNGYEQSINKGAELKDWKAKAYMADKEAGISPQTYAMYRVALQFADSQSNGDSRYSQPEAESAVNMIDGLSGAQKAYLYQSTNATWKKNPFGSATVTKYTSGQQEFINPCEGVQTSGFGPRDTKDIPDASKWHKSVDVGNDLGTPIVAVADGTVIAVRKGYNGGYGNSVTIDHGNGIVTEYHHMLDGSIDNIHVNDVVTQGQQIGQMGNTGKSYGSHLDLSVFKDGKVVDPITVIPGYGVGPSGHVYEGSATHAIGESGSSGGGSSGGSSGKKSSVGGSSRKSSGGGKSGGGLGNLKGLGNL